MALRYKPYYVPLAAGIDTKHDPRSLPAGKMGALENAIFDLDGGIQKAPGRDAVSLVFGTGGMGEQGDPVELDDLVALLAYKNELLIAADNEVYSRAPNAGVADLLTAQELVKRCRFESVRTEHETAIPNVKGSGAFSDRAEADDIAVYAYQTSSGTVAYRVIDMATGVALNEQGQDEPWNDNTISSAFAPKVRAVGGKLHIYYVDPAASPRTIKVLVIDPADVNGTITATPQSLTSADVHSGSQYDVDVDVANGQSIVAYRDDDGAGGVQYSILRVNSSGTVSGSVVAKSRACVGAIAVSHRAASSEVLIARHSGTNSVHLDWLGDGANFTDSGTVDEAVTTLLTPVRITCVITGASAGYVLWDTLHSTSYWRVMRATAAPTVTATKILVRHSEIASRAVLSDAGRALMHVVYASGVAQAQYVLLDCEVAVGDAGQSASSGDQQPGDEVGLLARVFPGAAMVPESSVAHLPQIENTDTDQYAAALISQRPLSTTQRQHLGVMTTERDLRNVCYNFGDARSYDGVEAGHTLYIPGGYLACYDGSRVREVGFWVYPEVDADSMTSVNNGSGPLEEGKSYSYILIWEHYNDRGEKEYSTFAGAITKTVTTGHDSFSITLPTLPYTTKEKVVLAAYRKQQGVEGGQFYRVSDASSQGPGGTTYVENDVNADTVTFSDLDYDETDMLSNELAPSNTGELDNVPPEAPPLVIAAGQSRIFYVHPENKSAVYYSKLRLERSMVAFNEALNLQIPDSGGDVTAIAPGEDTVIVFKENAVYRASGQGPDNLANGDYGPPQLVTTDQGCTEPRSVVRVPQGVIFKGDKGWHLVDRAYQVHFIGGPVEAYNDREVAGVLLYPAEHRLVVLCNDTDGSYAYDYRRNEWSDWPILPDVIDGVQSQGLGYYLEPDDVVSVETPTAWEDLASLSYSLAADTGWIPLSESLSGFGRCRWAQLLGEWRGDASFSLRCRIAYDYDETWIDDRTFTTLASAETIGKPLRVRVRPSRPKASAIRFRFEDVQQSATRWGEGMRLTGLTLSVGVKETARPLRAEQTR